MKRRRHIKSHHRRLALHAGDLDLAFHKRIGAIKDMPKRKKALIAKIKSLGWSFIHVPGNFTHKFWLRNTTYHRRIVLGSEWRDKSTRRQCMTLLHELVHIRQRKRLGRAKFLLYYGIAQWRWALEISAWRSNRLFSSARISAPYIYKFYKLGRLRRLDTLKETNAILDAVDNL